MNAPVVVIGSGLAGYMLAKELRKLDSDVRITIITQSDGSFYSKPLLSTALAQQKDVSALVTSPVNIMAEQLNAEILTHTSVEKINVKDKEVILADRIIPYRDCVLACGSYAITPPWSGSGVADVLSVNDLAAYGRFRDALEGKSKIAIIGAGLVGCEFANDLIASGHEVDIVAMESYPLNDLLTPEMGEVLATELGKEGVNWHFEKRVQQVNKENDTFTLVMGDGSEISAEVVLSAIGIRSNTSLAQDAGIKVEKGIVVDQCLQTSAEHVFALGDCAQINDYVLQYVAPLLQSARALAMTLAGDLTQAHLPAMPVAIKTTICPFVIALPAANQQTQWKVMGEEADYQALCYGNGGELIGFILSGTMTRERGRLQRELPALF